MVPVQEELSRPAGRREAPLVYHNAFPKPLFARRPELGWAIAVIALLAFAVLTWQVLYNDGLRAADDRMARAVYDWARTQSTPVVLVMRGFSSWGRDGIALLILLLVIGWTRRRQRRELHLLVFGVLGVELWFQLLSGLIARSRPEFKDPFEILIGHGYPSGHASTNLALAWLIVYLLWRRVQTPFGHFVLVAANALVVALVVFSRLFLGLHYPTDILAGLLLGTAWAAVVFTAVDRYFWRPRTEDSLLRQYGAAQQGERAVKQVEAKDAS